MHSHNAATLKIERARLWSLRTPEVVFYGSLACNLADVIDPTVETAATDGKRIRWSPDFVAGLTDEEVRFVLLHEVLHCAHAHFARLPLTEQGNIAGDYVINRVLRAIPGIRAPKGALDDRKFDGMAEEEVLAALDQQQRKPQPQPKPGNGSGKPQPDGNGAGDSGGEGQETPQPSKAPEKGSGKPGKGTDAGGCGGFEAPAPDAPNGETPAEATAEQVERWERAVVQAEQVAKATGRGSVPADLARLLDRVKAPAAVDWRTECAEFARNGLVTIADYRRSNRRLSAGNGKAFYPSRRVDSTGLVVFVRDTSGSVDSRMVAQFNDLIATTVATLRCEALVLDADARVLAEYRVGFGDEVPARAKGGGGTDFRPAFDRVFDLINDGEQVAGVIYLTDLDGAQPDDVPAPTLWVVTTKGAVARTGRTVHAAL